MQARWAKMAAGLRDLDDELDRFWASEAARVLRDR